MAEAKNVNKICGFVEKNENSARGDGIDDDRQGKTATDKCNFLFKLIS